MGLYTDKHPSFLTERDLKDLDAENKALLRELLWKLNNPKAAKFQEAVGSACNKVIFAVFALIGILTLLDQWFGIMS